MIVVMIKSFSSIVGVNVIDQASGRVLGSILGSIVNPDTGNIEAFWVKSNVKNSIILSSGIAEIKKNIYAVSENSVIPYSDVIRINEILKEGRFFLRNSVQSESGENYGRLYDFTFDTQHLAVRSIYVRRSFLGLAYYRKRIFDADRIIRIESYAVIIDDESRKQEPLLVKSVDPVSG